MAFRPFDFLFSREPAEERVTTYILREHGRGRSLADVLADRYVTNRVSHEQVERIFERPEVVEALGEDAIGQARAALAQARASFRS